MTEEEKAYIAGFLDGDGCVMFQIVHRKDYVYGYQIRASVVFYQKSEHAPHLMWIQDKLSYGYIRHRPDDMSEYTIVGISYVRKILEILYPYVRLKRPHFDLAFDILAIWPKRFTPVSLIAVGTLVDGFIELNYSKRRSNTVETLKKFFDEHGHSYVPVTTDLSTREGNREMVKCA